MNLYLHIYMWIGNVALFIDIPCADLRWIVSLLADAALLMLYIQFSNIKRS